MDNSGLHLPCLQKHHTLCLPLSGESEVFILRGWLKNAEPLPGHASKWLHLSCRAPWSPTPAAWGGASSRWWLLELPQEQLSAARQKYCAFRSQGTDNVFGLCAEETSDLVIGQAAVCEIQMSHIAKYGIPSRWVHQGVGKSYFLKPTLTGCEIFKAELCYFPRAWLSKPPNPAEPQFPFRWNRDGIMLYYRIEGASHHRVLWGLKELIYPEYLIWYLAYKQKELSLFLKQQFKKKKRFQCQCPCFYF